jgi:hypothetical protein
LRFRGCPEAFTEMSDVQGSMTINLLNGVFKTIFVVTKPGVHVNH